MSVNDLNVKLSSIAGVVWPVLVAAVIWIVTQNQDLQKRLTLAEYKIAATQLEQAKLIDLEAGVNRLVTEVRVMEVKMGIK